MTFAGGRWPSTSRSNYIKKWGQVVIEIPLMNKKDTKVNAYDGCLEVYAANIQERKYHHVVDIPSDIDIASGRSTYRNIDTRSSISQKNERI